MNSNQSVEYEGDGGEEGDEYSEESSDYLFNLLLTCSFSIFCAFVTLGNLFVIFAIVYFQRLRRNVSNCFIASLAFCDLITGTVVIPLGIYQKVTTKLFKLPITDLAIPFCDIFQSIHVITTAASILHLLAISLDRFYRIKEPLKYRTWMNYRKASFILIAIWLASFLDALMCLAIQKMGHVVYASECEYLGGEPYLYLIMGIFFIFIPSITLVVIYIKLYRLAVQYKSSCTSSQTQISAKGVRLRKHRIQGKRDKVHATLVPRQGSAIREHRAAVLIGFVLAAYLICFVPSVTMYFAKSFCETCQLATSLWYNVYPWLMWLNSGINPIIYLMLNNDFRRAFQRFFCRPCIGNTSNTRQLR